MLQAIRIIEGEHRGLAAIMHTLQSVLNDIDTRGAAPDFELFERIVEYISSFLYRFHHPKENDYLFRLLRERDADAARILDELEQEHRQGATLIKELQASLQAYKRQGEAAFDQFRKAVDVYHKFEWAHMEKERKEVLPLARERLTSEDWAKIDAAFTDHEDPLFGDKPKAEFQRLFSTIARLAPPPYGFGTNGSSKK